jgi:hypothetical protein
MNSSIGKITIQRESRWHLQIYVIGEYDYEEECSEYYDTLEECYEYILQFQESVTVGEVAQDPLDF